MPCEEQPAVITSLLTMPQDLHTKTQQSLLKVFHTKTLSWLWQWSLSSLGSLGLELPFPAGVLGWQLCCRSPCPQLWGPTQAVPGTDTQHGTRGDEAGAGTALVALGSGPWPWHGGTGRCGTCQECHSHRDTHSKNPQHTNRYS